MGAALLVEEWSPMTSAEVKVRYDAEKASMAHEYGSQGYSGTWASKAAGLTFPFDQKIVTRAEADAKMEQNDKWGSSFAIRFFFNNADKHPDEVEAATQAFNAKITNTFSFGKQRWFSLPTITHLWTEVDAGRALWPKLEGVGLADAWKRVLGGSESDFKSCKQCNSKLSIEHLKKRFLTSRGLREDGVWCPVCLSPVCFHAEGDLKRLNKLRDQAVLDLIDVVKLAKRVQERRAAVVREVNAGRVPEGFEWRWLVGGWCSS